MAEPTATTTPKTTKPRKKATPKTTVSTTAAATTTATTPRDEAKARFSKAIEEAKAGAAALGSEAKARSQAYRGEAKAKGTDLSAEAKVKARGFAQDGKGAISEAIAGLGKLVNDNAPAIDEKLGAKYGDYARTASKSLDDAAAKVDQKELDELADDAREFVRKSPGMAVGIAAVAGFMIAGLFRK